MIRYFIAALLSIVLIGAAQAQTVGAGGTLGLGNYPPGAIPITNSQTGTTAAISPQLSGATGLHTYICGYSVRATATAATIGDTTITNTVNGTMHFSTFVSTTSGPMVPLEETFWPCIPSSGTGTTIGSTTVTPGTGGVISATMWGYQAP